MSTSIAPHWDRDAPHRDVDARLRSPPTPTGRLEQEKHPALTAEQHRGDAGHGGASLAGARHFFRHFGEMFLAMMVGMMALGALDGGLLAAAGTNVRHVKDSAPEAFALVMALNMTVGMTLWMRYRRHSWAMCAEMAGAMFLPAVAALILLWCSVIHTSAVGGVEMTAMVPAMLGVMLFRRVLPAGARPQPSWSDPEPTGGSLAVRTRRLGEEGLAMSWWRLGTLMIRRA